MKIKQFLIPIMLIVILTMFNKIFMASYIDKNNLYNTDNLYNTEKVNSQKLFDKTWKVLYKDYYDNSYNHQDWHKWKQRYQNKIKTEDDAKVAIDTMIASLNEPYTRFMGQSDYEELTSSITSKIYGIGINIYSNAGKIEVFNVMPSTPAEFAQIKKGDVIIKVDNKDINGMNISEVANIVRGPENSVVELTLLRDNKKVVKKIKRKEIKIKNVKSSVLNNNIGYIQIISFMGATTPNEFIQALENTKNTNGLIIDLRGNTGGLLDNAVFIANMFINKGEVVEIIYRNGKSISIKPNENVNIIKKPIIILVNGASASASEIFSGALKDYKLAKLVGTKTFGKGLVQKVVPLPNKTGLNVTIARYLTPNGTDIDKQGIKPDVVIGNDFDFFIDNKKDDIQLETAKNMLLQNN